VTAPNAPRRRVRGRGGLAPAGVAVLLVLVLLVGMTVGLLAGRREAADRRSDQATRDARRYLAERKGAGGFALSPLGVVERLVARRPTSILDVRSRKEFAFVHLRGARNLPLPELLAGRRPSLGNRPVVVVDRDGAGAVEGMVFLRLAGKPAFAMTGGMDRLRRLVTKPAEIPRRSLAARRSLEVRALLTGRDRQAPVGVPDAGVPAGAPDAGVRDTGGAAGPPTSPSLLPGVLSGLVVFLVLAGGWRWYEQRRRPVRDAFSLLARDDQTSWHAAAERLSRASGPQMDPEASFGLAYARAQLGQLKEASTIVEAMAPSSRREPAVLHLDLWLRVEQHQYDGAATLWERTASERLKEFEESRRLAALAFLALAREALAARNVDQALHRFDQIRGLGVLVERIPDTASDYRILSGIQKLLEGEVMASREAFWKAEMAEKDDVGSLLPRLGVLLCDWRTADGTPDADFDRRLDAVVKAVRATPAPIASDQQRLLRDLLLWQAVARVAGWKRDLLPGRRPSEEELERFKVTVGEVRDTDMAMPDPDLLEGLLGYFLAEPGDRQARDRAVRQLERACDHGVTLQQVQQLLEGPVDTAEGVDGYLSGVLGGYLRDARVPSAARWQVRQHLSRFERVQPLLEEDLQGADLEFAPSLADLEARGALLQERVSTLVLPELAMVDPEQAEEIRRRMRRLQRTVALLRRATDAFTQLEQRLVVLTGEFLLRDERAGRQ
jgi:rhodanese-related sulfurtransferase